MGFNEKGKENKQLIKADKIVILQKHPCKKMVSSRKKMSVDLFSCQCQCTE
jgi:hypothetical protein